MLFLSFPPRVGSLNEGGLERGCRWQWKARLGAGDLVMAGSREGGCEGSGTDRWSPGERDSEPASTALGTSVPKGQNASRLPPFVHALGTSEPTGAGAQARASPRWPVSVSLG